MSTVNVFDTNNLTNDSPGLRYTCVAVAGLVVLIVLLYALYQLATKGSSMSVGMDSCLSAGSLMFLALVSLFFSFFIASLNMSVYYLVAAMVFFVFVGVSVVTSMSSYITGVQKKQQVNAARWLTWTLLSEFCLLVLLMTSPTAAGTAGTVSQSTLLVPTIALSLGAIAVGSATPSEVMSAGVADSAMQEEPEEP